MNSPMKKITHCLLPIMALFMFTVAAHANEFAEKFVVLQISDAESQTKVLNVANNLIKHYGPDKVAVEIVAFGPGLKLLFANNEVTAPRIEGMQANGVKFSACANTIAAIKRKSGKEPKLNPHSTVVSAGVVRIMDLVEQGYTLVRP
jgi:hypothetical protein